MELLNKAIYYKEHDRNQYFRNMFIQGVEKGINSQVLLALAMYPKLQQERFEIDTTKLNDKVKEAFYFKDLPKSAFKERQKQPDYPEKTEVNFSYYLLKNNQSELLKRIISSDSEQPFVTPPYQRINLFDKSGKERLHIIFYEDHNGEPFTREQGLKMIAQGLAMTFDDDPISNIMAHSLPNYLQPIHQNDVAKQLRFLYKLDDNIPKMSQTLYQERGINLIASYPSIIPDDVNPKVKLDDIMGIGESMDSDWWKNVQEKRAEYEKLNKEYLASTQNNYQTNVISVWKDGKEELAQNLDTNGKTGGASVTNGKSQDGRGLRR